MKNKIISLLSVFALMLLALTACSGGAPEQESQPPLEGYTLYTNPNYDIQFQYPENWTLIDSESLDSTEMMEVLEGELNLDEATIQTMLNSVEAYFYDFDRSTESVAPNMNLVVTSASGSTQAAITNDATVSQLKDQFTSQYESVFGAIDWITDPHATTFGSNKFVVMEIGYEMAGAGLNVYQALTADGENLYTFSYTDSAEYMNDEVRATLENILGSVVLGK